MENIVLPEDYYCPREFFVYKDKQQIYAIAVFWDDMSRVLFWNHSLPIDGSEQKVILWLSTCCHLVQQGVQM